MPNKWLAGIRMPMLAARHIMGMSDNSIDNESVYPSLDAKSYKGTSAEVAFGPPPSILERWAYAVVRWTWAKPHDTGSHKFTATFYKGSTTDYAPSDSVEFIKLRPNFDRGKFAQTLPVDPKLGIVSRLMEPTLPGSPPVSFDLKGSLQMAPSGALALDSWITDLFAAMNKDESESGFTETPFSDERDSYKSGKFSLYMRRTDKPNTWAEWKLHKWGTFNSVDGSFTFSDLKVTGGYVGAVKSTFKFAIVRDEDDLFLPNTDPTTSLPLDIFPNAFTFQRDTSMILPGVGLVDDHFVLPSGTDKLYFRPSGQIHLKGKVVSLGLDSGPIPPTATPSNIVGGLAGDIVALLAKDTSGNWVIVASSGVTGSDGSFDIILKASDLTSKTGLAQDTPISVRLDCYPSDIGPGAGPKALPCTKGISDITVGSHTRLLSLHIKAGDWKSRFKPGDLLPGVMGSLSDTDGTSSSDTNPPSTTYNSGQYIEIWLGGVKIGAVGPTASDGSFSFSPSMTMDKARTYELVAQWYNPTTRKTVSSNAVDILVPTIPAVLNAIIDLSSRKWVIPKVYARIQAALTGTLMDDSGNAVVGRTVYVAQMTTLDKGKAEDELAAQLPTTSTTDWKVLGAIATDGTGSFSLPTTFAKAETVHLAFYFRGDDVYAATRPPTYVDLKVLKSTPKLTADAPALGHYAKGLVLARIGKAFTLQGNLTDTTGAGIRGESIAVKYTTPGKAPTTTNTTTLPDGSYGQTFTPSIKGDHNLLASFAGDDAFDPTNAPLLTVTGYEVSSRGKFIDPVTGTEYDSESGLAGGIIGRGSGTPGKGGSGGTIGGGPGGGVAIPPAPTPADPFWSPGWFLRKVSEARSGRP